MKTPFPLFARLLLWFFGNLLVLVLGLALMVRVQFGSLDNWLLPATSQAEIQAMSMTLMDRLSHTERQEWGGELAELSAAYKMDFALYDSHAVRMAGATWTPPQDIRNALVFAQPTHPSPGGFQSGPGMLPSQEIPRIGPNPEALPAGMPPPGTPPPGAPPPGTPPPARLGPNFPMNVLISDSPKAYWLMVRLPPEPLQMDGPVTLVGRTEALGISPLMFDPKPWFAVAAGIVLFSILFWFPLARNLTRSITEMTHATESIAAGRFDIKLNHFRRDELGRLSHAINRMAAQLKALIMGQKRFLGDAAHELCSPLARMEIALEILDERSNEESHRYVADVREELNHMRQLVNEVLSFSKAALGESHLKLGPVNLAEIVAAAVRLEKGETGVIEVDVPNDLKVRGHVELLQRAVANLVRNALRYAGTERPILVAARSEGEEVLVTVADEGPGVSAGDLERLFDPFYRVDSSRTLETGGVGLGLAIVKSGVEACGGSVSAANRSPQGLEIRIRLQRVMD